MARRTDVARLTGPVVVMRESGEDEEGGGGARKAMLIAKVCAATWPQRRGNMLRSWFAGCRVDLKVAVEVSWLGPNLRVHMCLVSTFVPTEPK